MKNYKKIYNKLIKEIKKEAEQIPELNNHELGNYGLLETIENNSQVSVLNWVLSLLPEIEGRECQMIIMNKKEFKKWKRNITITI